MRRRGWFNDERRRQGHGRQHRAGRVRSDVFRQARSDDSGSRHGDVRVTNVGELTHEFVVYSNLDDVATGDLPINSEEDAAALVEENVIGAAPYATPPIVPPDKKPGDADHRIPGGGWGAEFTVDLAAGKYILLCNLPGHYTGGKQYSAFTVE